MRKNPKVLTPEDGREYCQGVDKEEVARKMTGKITCSLCGRVQECICSEPPRNEPKKEEKEEEDTGTEGLAAEGAFGG